MNRIIPIIFALFLGCGDSPTASTPHPLVGAWVSQPQTYHVDGHEVEVVTELTLRANGTADLRIRCVEDSDHYVAGALISKATGIWQERAGEVAFLWEEMTDHDLDVFQAVDAWWWPDRIVIGTIRKWIFSRTNT